MLSDLFLRYHSDEAKNGVVFRVHMNKDYVMVPYKSGTSWESAKTTSTTSRWPTASTSGATPSTLRLSLGTSSLVTSSSLNDQPEPLSECEKTEETLMTSWYPAVTAVFNDKTITKVLPIHHHHLSHSMLISASSQTL